MAARVVFVAAVAVTVQPGAPLILAVALLTVWAAIRILAAPARKAGR